MLAEIQGENKKKQEDKIQEVKTRQDETRRDKTKQKNGQTLPFLGIH
jgi:hypothetical protein